MVVSRASGEGQEGDDHECESESGCEVNGRLNKPDEMVARFQRSRYGTAAAYNTSMLHDMSVFWSCECELLGG
jgi:hypothetical protein